MDRFVDDTPISPQDNAITQYLNDNDQAVIDARSETQAAEDEARSNVEVPSLADDRQRYLDSLQHPDVLADQPGDEPRGVELTDEVDDFLPYLHDLEDSHDLREQAYQDKQDGTERNPGDVSNKFLLPEKKTVMGIDLATGQRIMNRGDLGNEAAQEAYAEGVDKLSQATINVNEGYDYQGLEGLTDVANGILLEGGSQDDFNRAVNLTGVPPEQAKLAWYAANARQAQIEIAESIEEDIAGAPDTAYVPPEMPDIEASELPEVPGWEEATRYMYEAEEGAPFEGTERELIDWYVSEMSSFNWKIGVPGVNTEGMAYYMVRALEEGEEYSRHLLSMIDTYERVNTNWGIIGQNIGNILTDPVNLVGLGGGAAALKAGGVVAKQAMKNHLVRLATAGAGAGLVEGGVWAGGAETMMQTIEQEAGFRDDYQIFPDGEQSSILGTAAFGSAVGMPLGATLGVGLPIAGRTAMAGARRARRNLAQARRTGPLSRQIGAVGDVSRVSPLRGVSSLRNAVKAASKETYKTNRDLKKKLQEDTRRAMDEAGIDLSENTPEANQALRELLVEDALYALVHNSNAVGWYDHTVGAALEVLSTLHPELKTDPKARFAFTYALAVTSNGLKVDKNFELAEKAYRGWKETGKMPTDVGTGTAASEINNSLGRFNDWADQIGTETLAKIFDGTFTVGQLKQAGLSVSGELIDEQVLGAAVLGPKIGNGFFSNLNGRFDQLTMDRWFMSTWGRLTGTLLEPRHDLVKQKKSAMREQIKSLRAEHPDEIKAWEELGVKFNLNDLEGTAKQIQKASMLPGNRAVMNKTPQGDTLRKLGNGVVKDLAGEKLTPTAQDRRRIRGVMRGVLQDLRAKYPELSMADLQALLWYPEKRLYDRAKSADDVAEGYADDEAPDYANAAIKLAVNNGVDQSTAIEAANRGRTAGTRRTLTADGDEAEQGQGFSPRERSKWLRREVYAENRPGRKGGKPLRSFKRKGAGTNRTVRGLIATHTPSSRYGKLLADSEMPAPVIHEYGPEKADDFKEAISKSKAASPFGAAVYVYPDYKDMKLFMTEDGGSGFAIKEDGDIVSVFSSGGGNVYSMLQLAVEQGGTKLDAFDTVLPELYGIGGFKEVDRVPWNDDYMPDNWDKETFGEFNEGEPDIVYMEYDKNYVPERLKKLKQEKQTRDWPDRALDVRDSKNFQAALRFMEEHSVQEINQGETPPPGQFSFMLLDDGRIRAYTPWTGERGTSGLSQKTFGQKVTLRALRDWMGY